MVRILGFSLQLAKLVITFIFVAVTINHLVEPVHAASANQPAPIVYPIMQYVDMAAASNIVMIRGGRTDGIVDGAEFLSYRQAKVADGQTARPIWVETGRLKALRVDDKLTVAEVTAQGSLLSKAFFPNYPGVMASDLVAENQPSISRNQLLTPTKNLAYGDLFVDAKSLPTSFELSSSGKEILAKAAQTFADMRLNLLFVEGYTDANGPSDANQVESYQRALTVRQYLIEELGFDPDRVIAIGFGESEQTGEEFVPGNDGDNRRIVLKAKAL